MSAHTPGPWELAEDGEVSGCDGARPVAKLYLVDDFPCRSEDEDDEADFEDEVAANGRLIAAAPDLLAALIAVVGDDCADADRESFLPEWKQALAAISKATGESEA